ncbi:MAG: glycosyl hydrolase family 57 [Clostridia bacterium]|nr:glycosyl hydrolase family 57 [Clostridia bacterium]
MDYKIHIAYGFHVNCYHSYRGDTNDDKGFGSDIRIIRKIIGTLDKLNAEGIPVKGTWDSENFFSLEQILPQYAPDIIEGMKRRVRENGDENIIMGYSNGALGAMQEDELAASINLAVSNPQGSGLKDIFGKCEMIVRPQEVMFTPSQVHTYNKLGVKALCLYYSCVPFDAFKTLIKPLPDEQAFNPLTFEYKGEGLTVIPTYSNADVCDAGCLRAWVKDLRKKQESGEIKRDLFIFINMDADAIFWESLNLPVIGSRIANTDGINGLVREVADLDYVVFDTPGGYLASHAPAGKISFTQDTADGNFTGYASWSEKPYNRKIWTAIERSRTAGKALKNENDFLDRVKLLSTTHFGLATPVLNIQRETAANSLARELTDASIITEGPLTIHNTSGTALQCLQLSYGGNKAVKIEAEGLKAQTVIPMGNGSVFVMLKFNEIKDTYTIRAAETDYIKKPLSRILTSGNAKLEFTNDNRVKSFTCGGRKTGGEDFLNSYLTYGGKRYDFGRAKLLPGDITGGECVILEGDISLPGALKQGKYRYSFFTSDMAEGIFAVMDITYPYTPERDAISTENSTLGRYTDMEWSEAAPFAISFKNEGDVSVIKRNYEGDISSFRVSSYGEADERNKTLDSFNNQLSAGLTGLADGKGGILLANARNVLSSMAHCPMRLSEDGSVTMNPFGTFFGKQRHHINRSGDRIPLTYTLIAPQGKSLAPSYNGSSERAVICLLPFEGKEPESEKLTDLLAFADGAFATGTDGILSPFEGENAAVHAAESNLENVKIRSPLLSGIKGNLGRYIVRGAKAVIYITGRQKKAK